MADKKDLKKFKNGIRLDPSSAPANSDKGTMYVDTSGNLQIHDGSYRHRSHRYVDWSAPTISGYVPQLGDTLDITGLLSASASMDMTALTFNNCTIINSIDTTTSSTREEQQVLIKNISNSRVIHNSVNNYIHFKGSSGTARNVDIQHDAYPLLVANGTGDAYGNFYGCTFRSTFSIQLGNAALPADINYRNCTFYGNVNIFNSASYENKFTDCIFMGNVAIQGSNNVVFTNCVLQKDPTYSSGASSATFTNSPITTNIPATAAVFVGAKYTKNDSQSIANLSITRVEFDDETYDTNSGMDTSSNVGRYTVPTTGYYMIETTIYWSAIDLDAGDWIRTYININGTITKITEYEAGVDYTATQNFSQSVMDVANITAGQYIEIQVFQSTGGAESVYSPDPIATMLTITKLN